MRYLLAILTYLFFTVSTFACEFLIYAQHHWMEFVDRSNWTKVQLDKYERSYRKGDLVVVMPNGHKWGNEERPPKFVIVKVPDLNVEVARNYITNWERKCSLILVTHDTKNDTYDVEIVGDLVSPSNVGQITKEEVLEKCKKFNITILAHGPNYVKVRIQGTNNFNKLKERKDEILAKIIRRRRFHLTEAQVDYILNHGGVLEIDKAIALQKIKDKVKDE